MYQKTFSLIFLAFLICLKVQCANYNCSITSVPLKRYNGDAVEPLFRFVSSYLPNCTNYTDTAADILLSLNGQNCNFTGKQTFRCQNKTYNTNPLGCKVNLTGNNQIKKINVIGTVTFIKTGESCSVDGQTTLQWYDPSPKPQPGPDSNLGLVLGIIGGALAIVIVAIVVVCRKRKARKAQILLSEEKLEK